MTKIERRQRTPDEVHALHAGPVRRAHEQFVRAYCKTLNAPAAYRIVHGGRPGADSSRKYMDDPWVRREIARLTEHLPVATNENIIAELAKIAFHDARKTVARTPRFERDPTTGFKYDVGEDTPIALSQLDDVTAAAVVEYRTGGMSGTSIKLESKRGALMDLARLRGMVTVKAEVKAHVSLSPLSEFDEGELFDALTEGQVIDGELVDDDVPDDGEP